MSIFEYTCGNGPFYDQKRDNNRRANAEMSNVTINGRP